MASYVVVHGDTIDSIAHKHGMKTWQELYDAQPEAWKASHPEVGSGDKVKVMVHPGETVTVP